MGDIALILICKSCKNEEGLQDLDSFLTQSRLSTNKAKKKGPRLREFVSG